MDLIEQRATSERLVAVQMKAAGWKLQGGGQIEIPDPDDAVKRFNQTLLAPLDIEKQRAELLELARTA